MRTKLNFVIVFCLVAILASSTVQAGGWRYKVNRPVGCGCDAGDLTVYATHDGTPINTPLKGPESLAYPVDTGDQTPAKHTGIDVTDLTFKWDCAGDSPDCHCTTAWSALGAKQWLPGQSWHLSPLNEWLDQNGDEITLPILNRAETCGAGVGGDLYAFADLTVWDNGPILSSYSVVDGVCPDLPGFLIGTTPILFDPAAPEGGSPFWTANPYTGTLVVNGDTNLQATPASAVTEWGLIALTILVVLTGVILIANRLKVPSAKRA